MNKQEFKTELSRLFERLSAAENARDAEFWLAHVKTAIANASSDGLTEMKPLESDDFERLKDLAIHHAERGSSKQFVDDFLVRDFLRKKGLEKEYLP